MTEQYNPWSDLPICGCGAPEEALTMLHWLLWYYTPAPSLAEFQDHLWPAKKQFMAWVGLSDYGDDHAPKAGLAWLAIYFLDHIEATEHGCSVRAGWLTEKGVRMRQWLDDHGCDPDGWPQ